VLVSFPGQFELELVDGTDSMTKMTISLPDSLADYIAARVTSGKYSDASAFLRDLILRDKENHRLDDEELRDLLKKAEQSGPSDRRIPDILADAKAKLRGRI